MEGIMRKLFVMIMMLIPSFVLAGPIPSVCHDELSAWIKAGKSLFIVDIQDAEEFHEHHYDQSLATGNAPARLKKISRRLRSTKGKVVVVSSTGGADAVRAWEKLVLGGVQRSRVLVLEGGMEAAAKNAACDCCKPASLQGVSE
jgi:rhodanese-related sulfurtransferase